MNKLLSQIAKAFFSEEGYSLPPVARTIVSRVGQELPQRNILLLDNSDSMEAEDYPPNRLEAAKECAIEFLRERATRSPSDEIAVISFGSRAYCKCKLTSVTKLREIEKAINGISLDFLTAMGRGLKKAEKIFDIGSSSPLENGVFIDRIILLTDGRHCHGCLPLPIAERLKEAGVQINCIGIAGNRLAIDELLLRQIASTDELTGTPRYRFIKDRGALQKHFQELATGLTR